jgi:hypothetical protein
VSPADRFLSHFQRSAHCIPRPPKKTLPVAWPDVTVSRTDKYTSIKQWPLFSSTSKRIHVNLVGKLRVLEKIEATCRAWLAISMAVWHKHFPGMFSPRPLYRPKSLWWKMDRRPGGPHNRCGSLCRKENSLASAKNRTSDRLTEHCWAVPEQHKEKLGLWTQNDGQVGAVCGSDYPELICMG